MAIDADTLLTMTDLQLKTLRQDYVGRRNSIARSPSTRGNMLPTDTRRCNDAIGLIDSILRKRKQSRSTRSRCSCG
jgi:hypothetical protein